MLFPSQTTWLAAADLTYKLCLLAVIYYLDRPIAPTILFLPLLRCMPHRSHWRIETFFMIPCLRLFNCIFGLCHRSFILGRHKILLNIMIHLFSGFTELHQRCLFINWTFFHLTLTFCGCGSFPLWSDYSS